MDVELALGVLLKSLDLLVNFKPSEWCHRWFDEFLNEGRGIIERLNTRLLKELDGGRVRVCLTDLLLGFDLFEITDLLAPLKIDFEVKADGLVIRDKLIEHLDFCENCVGKDLVEGTAF